MDTEGRRRRKRRAEGWRWDHMHAMRGGHAPNKTYKLKIRFDTWEEAEEALRVMRSDPTGVDYPRRDTLGIYPCYWNDIRSEGRGDTPHYHLGRRRGQENNG